MINLKASGEGAAKTLDVEVYGVIEPGWFDEGGTKSADVAAQLRANADASSITVHINSVGGDTFGGVAIYNLLRETAAAKKGRLVCVVEGLAASAASLIALAGTTRMLRGSMLMIHNPWTIAMGDANALRETADNLDTVRDAILEIYRSKTGKSDAKLRQLLDAETYFTAEQAKAEGFADEVEASAVKARSSADQVFFGAVGFDRARLEPRILAMVAEPPPAPTPPPPAAPEGETMKNPLLLQVVGLPAEADEPMFDERVQALADFEGAIKAQFGVETADEVRAKVAEAQAALVELPQLRARVGQAEQAERKRDLRASLEGGLYTRRLNLGVIQRTLPLLVADSAKRAALKSAFGAIKTTTRAAVLDAACSVDLTAAELDTVKDYVASAPLVSPDPVREPSREGLDLQAKQQADAKLLAARMEKVDEELKTDPDCTPSVAWSRAAAKHKALFADGVGANPSEEK